MHIIVIGAGIVGMTSAYYLVRKGYQVTVVDAMPGPGLLTSKANGAQLSYSFVAPLAEPTVPRKLPAWLWAKDSPLSLRLRADPAQWRWCLAFLAACRSGVSRRTTAELLALGAYSRGKMHELLCAETLDFDFSQTGKLLVYQDAAAFESAKALVAYQAGLGSEQQVLSRDACLAQEPALQAIAARIRGGIMTHSEDAGDCLQLCRELERILRQGAIPARFLYDTEVTRLDRQGDAIVGLQTSTGRLKADAYVLANGVQAQALARQANFNPQIYPLKGYSLTYALTAESRAPRVSVSDIHNKIVYARLGNRLRVAGMVDIGDTTAAIDARRVASLKRAVRRFFPELHPAGEPVPWAGLRPARPDSKPLIGATAVRNLWINAGHGALGFTLAAGSAALLADRIAGAPGALAQALFTP